MLHLNKEIACICGVIAVAMMLISCDRGKDNYMAQVDQIPISQPPHFELPQTDNPLDSQGIYKPSDSPIYGAIAPVKYQLISKNDKETRVFVPNMMSLDIERFVKTYFSNQKNTHYAVSGKFEIFPEPSEDVVNADGGLADGAPKDQAAQKLVHITIRWQRDYNRFEWIYENPDYIAPEPEVAPKTCATCKMAGAVKPDSQPDVAPAPEAGIPQVVYKKDPPAPDAIMVDVEKLPPSKEMVQKEFHPIKLQIKEGIQKDPPPVISPDGAPDGSLKVLIPDSNTEQKETK